MTAIEDLTDNEIAVTLEHLRAEISDLEAEQARRHPHPSNWNYAEMTNKQLDYKKSQYVSGANSYEKVVTDYRAQAGLIEREQETRRAYLQSVAANGEGN